MNDLALVVAGLALAGVVVADLAFSPRYMRTLRSAVGAGDTAARTRMYRLTLGVSWAAALVALALMLAGGLSASEIGFRLPRAGALERYAGVFIAVTLGIVGGGVAMAITSRRARTDATPVVGNVDVLLPRTGAERRWFVAVAVTAGITEEVFYRAFALTFLLSVLPGDGRIPAVLIAAALFAAAHTYQGAVGVAATAVLALLLGWLYVGTGSLLPGIFLHALIDLRALALPAPADPLAADH